PMCWKASAVPTATVMPSARRAAPMVWIFPVSSVSDMGTSEQIGHGDEAADEKQHEEREEKAEMLLDECADRLAEPVQQPGDEEEAKAAAEYGHNHECDDVEPGEAGEDRQYLVGEGRHRTEKDAPRTPCVVPALDVVERVLGIVEGDDMPADA